MSSSRDGGLLWRYTCLYSREEKGCRKYRVERRGVERRGVEKRGVERRGVGYTAY
jgi:hypothetical protein